MAYQVSILSSARGRFVLKVARTPTLVEVLANEARVLAALREYVPFVAQPLVNAETDEGHAFLFSWIEGKPLHVALKDTDAQGRHDLIVQFGQALRRIHAWTPDLPCPENWLSEKLKEVSLNILSRSPEALLMGTNSRFDGINARHLLTELLAWQPHVSNDLVFGHGDNCLPNVLVHNQQISGVIDWSGGGYADRRFDLATALFTMRLANPPLDATAFSTFLQAYGYTEPIETLYHFEMQHALTCFWP